MPQHFSHPLPINLSIVDMPRIGLNPKKGCLGTGQEKMGGLYRGTGHILCGIFNVVHIGLLHYNNYAIHGNLCGENIPIY